MFKWLDSSRDKGTRTFATVAEGLQTLYKEWGLRLAWLQMFNVGFCRCCLGTLIETSSMQI